MIIERRQKMGSFSWEYASETSETINICPGDEIKVLIPEYFGIGKIIGTYEDYGIVSVGDKDYDIYDLLAIINVESLSRDDEVIGKIKDYHTNKHLPTPQEIGDDEIRNIGINIESADLKYPLKIVPPDEDVTYETCEYISGRDYEQGSHRVYRDDKPYNEECLRVEDVDSEYALENFNQTIEALQAMKVMLENEGEDYEAALVTNMLNNPEHTKAEIERMNIGPMFDYEEFIYELTDDYRTIDGKEDDMLLGHEFDEDNGLTL